MAKRSRQRQLVDETKDRDLNAIWMDHGGGCVVPIANSYAVLEDRIVVIREADILLQTQLLRFGERVDFGRIIAATTPAWSTLRREVLANKSPIELFPKHHRKFEEFVAGGYSAARWTDVVLSPRSRDGGFDVAARRCGRQILDEVKAYKRTLFVGHQIVRAALGLLTQHENINQVRVTTTSSFAPLVFRDFDHLIPDRLKLRDKRQLLRWLSSIGSQLN
jgi:Restriction endonuclease